MTYHFNKQEEKEIDKIKKAYYITPTLSKIDSFVNSFDNQKEGWKLVFNQLNAIISDAYEEVNAILDNRLKSGKIKDKKQANKAVVGNTFPFAVIYIFLQNKIVGNIQENIFITSQLKQVKNFDKISVINIGNDTQKPDCDLLIYSCHDDESVNKCIILSLKTSLRERAAQTYKWKLLMEIATSNDCSVKDKYDISYEVDILPKICFATINFYDEINNPQQRGMLKFFDRSFLAKNIDEDLPNFIYPLSNLIDFVHEIIY